MLKILSTVITLVMLTSGAFSQSNDKPFGLHLTWQYDPTTTMTIDWHVEESHVEDNVIHYRKAGSRNWQTAEANQIAFPHTDRTIHRVELTGLDPASEYEFRTGSFPKVYKFRTMPEDLNERPLIFATGGDTRHRKEWMLKTNEAAMQYDLDFVLWGGDFAYADGRADRYDRWYEWFEANYEGLMTEDGRVVPVLGAVGNHEVLGGYYHNNDRRSWLPEYVQNDASRTMIAPYFYTLFAFPGQPGYAALDFGNYLSIFLLDTDHTNPIEGKQAEWLDKELRERARRKVPHVFPTYHVPAYPSHRSYSSGTISNVRETWIPLFEKHGLQVVFENHDHTYKRTHPIRNGEISEGGIVYIGDGAWGTTPREGNSQDEWYIDQFQSIRHAIIVTIDNEKKDFIMIDEDGEVFDTYTRPNQR